ncbi:MAG: hypothetical protein ACTSW1_01315 [Candidatus Hodarchaeales archaeon]
MSKEFNKPLFIFLVLIASFLIPSIFIIPFAECAASEISPDTIVELGDVVVVNYTLIVDTVEADNQEGTVYVEDPSNKVPDKIVAEYPDIFKVPNIGFLEGLLGMRSGQNKTWEVPSSKGFTNTSDPLYGENLFYIIFLKEILYDASVPPITLTDLPFLPLITFIVVVLLSIIIYFRIKRFVHSRNILGLKKYCSICGLPAEVRCGNSACNTLYCRKCFQEKGCRICHSNKMVSLKK